MKLKIAQVIGLNTDQKAAQVISSQREDNSFLAVLLLTSDDAFTKGRQILSELNDFYFEFEGSAAEKLKATFVEAQDRLSQETDFSLVLGAVLGKVLYIIGKGQVEVYLKRTEKLSPLLPVGAPSELISGFIVASDRLLFATSSLISFLGPDLEKSFNLPIETFEEEVGSKIGVSDSANQGLAALVVEVWPETLDDSQQPMNINQQVDEHQREVSKSNFGNQTLGLLKSLSGYLPRSGKSRLILAGVLFVIIILGAGYKYKLSKDQARQLQFDQILREAKDNLDAAKGLGSLNPAEAKTKLEGAKDKIDQALALKPNDKGAQNIKKQIETDSPSILQQLSVSAFPIFLDLDLVKKDFKASFLSLSAGKLLILDPDTKTLVVIDLTKKSNQILAGSTNLGDAKASSLNGGLSFVFSKDKGVLRVDLNSSKVTTVSKKDNNWGDIKDIYGFAGNVYLLDVGKNQIWKYLPAQQGYSDKREYFSKDTKADLSTAIRMQIESSIYVLKTGGEILRFTKGNSDSFSYSGLPSNVKDPKSLFTSSDTDNLYLLDSGNSRLLILTKTGAFKGEVNGNKFGTATDLVVDEADKKVYLLEGSKIYTVDLK